MYEVEEVRILERARDRHVIDVRCRWRILRAGHVEDGADEEEQAVQLIIRKEATPDFLGIDEALGLRKVRRVLLAFGRLGVR